MPPARPLVLVLLAILVPQTAPVAGALIAGNNADISVTGEGNSVALCQVLVVVNAVILLELEDGLGLVTPAAREPAEIAIPAPPPTEGGRAFADCSIHLGRLHVRYEDGVVPRGSYVSGPPAVAGATGIALENRLRVVLAGAENAVAACQYLLLVNSVIIGGGAYGFAPGSAPSILRLPVANAYGVPAGASCRASVGSVIVD